MESHARATPEWFKLRVVDIGSWSSPIARQHRIGQLPTLWLFEDGERVATDTAAVLTRLESTQPR